jgi:hypothetical protein
VMTISWFTNGMFYFTEECPSRRRSSLIADGKNARAHPGATLPKSGKRWGIRKTKADPSGKTSPRDDSFWGGHPRRRGNHCRLKAPFEAPSKLGTPLRGQASQGKPLGTQGKPALH